MSPLSSLQTPSPPLLPSRPRYASVVKLLSWVLLLLVIISIGLYFFNNFFLERPSAVMQQPGENIVIDDIKESLQPTLQGSFRQLDIVRQAQGQVAIYQTGQGPILSLENFSVVAGPDLFLYLSPKSTLLRLSPNLGKFISLGKLKSAQGNQTYSLPDNYRDYHSVVIWSRTFGILFSAASLY